MGKDLSWAIRGTRNRFAEREAIVSVRENEEPNLKKDAHSHWSITVVQMGIFFVLGLRRQAFSNFFLMRGLCCRLIVL